MSRFHNRNFELLEPYDAKVSCTVLRGESIRKDADLLDIKIFPTVHQRGKINVGSTCYPFHAQSR